MRWISVLTFLAILGSGLGAGVFFTFSSFVMPALGRLPTERGIAAMQSINVAAVTPAFMAVFMGTAALSLVLAIAAIFRLSAPGAPLLLAASLCYFFGAFAVTAAVNVPLNDALAAAKPDSPEAAALWAKYLTNWTLWNHVRTVASLVSLALFVLAWHARSNS